ncbi:Uncharacterized conserved protein, DUF1800 family [Filimonas lacunae]|uniref:Uncharacterized conserved protein, DUF1800 family n=1 Tax=Filimonas lacunae TaxID=477680 RepID=A0A173MFV5_9BACT|nr:signal peptide protein [Filimonas lacunae]SIT26693.1 Uncharacterized conserved protein, DUF1800 family [Filimonas lacunae]
MNSGLKPFKGKWTEAEARHLLKRTQFGAKPADVKDFARLSVAQCVSILINTAEPAPLPPVNDYNDINFTDPDVPAGETWVNVVKSVGTQNFKRQNSLKIWWTGQMLFQSRTIREKMVVFLHNHFVTETRIVGSYMAYQYNALLRDHALGNFKTLVKQISINAAMLRYLNGAQNTKKAPDENYARELQELFTVGKGPGSHYTEADVKAAAKVLTGYTINNTTGTYQFVPDKHDEGDKSFSAFYNNHVIHGRKGKEGEQELDELLDMIFAKEEVSCFICRKLYRFFVYHHIDEHTEKNIIVPLAQTFRKSNYEIKPVLQQLLQSTHFYDMANRGGIIKSPLDFAAGMYREFDIQLSKDIDIVSKSRIVQRIYQFAATTQQNIGDPPNVAGWPSWYQEPLYDKLWINSDTYPKRSRFAISVIQQGINFQENCIARVDIIEFAKKTSDPSQPDVLINDSIQLLYPCNLSETERTQIKNSILLTNMQGNMGDHYWTQAWLQMLQKPDDKTIRNNVLNRLNNLYKYLVSLPQYQLC